MKRVDRAGLYPTPRQLARLLFMLDMGRELHYAALEQRRDAHRRCRVTITAKQQSAELTAPAGNLGR